MQKKVHAKDIDRIAESLARSNHPAEAVPTTEGPSADAPMEGAGRHGHGHGGGHGHPIVPETAHSYHYYYISSSNRESEQPKLPNQDQLKNIEDAMKYVLFSINYEQEINEGETKSLELKMSSRDFQNHLEQVLSSRGVQKENIKDFIRRLEPHFKYVSADLTAKNGCLRIEKKRPFENVVYIPNANESYEGEVQLWQWDLTAPEKAVINPCRLSLFIRFCNNQSDCFATKDPDEEIIIEIKVNFVNRFFGWIEGWGGFASALAAILGLLGALLGIIKGWWPWRKIG